MATVKYVCLTLFLITGLLFAKDKPILVMNYDRVEIAGTTYTGSPDSTKGRYNSDGKLTYEFDELVMTGNFVPDFTKAKKLTVRHWDAKTGKFKSQNILGGIKKAEKVFPLIGKKEKKKNEMASGVLGKQK